MKLRTFIIASAILLLPVAAYAAEVSGSWVESVIAPYVAAAVSGLISVLIIWASYLVQRWTGYKITEVQRQSLHSAAETAAGMIWAKAEPSIATAKIDITNPILAQGVDWMKKSVPDAIKSVAPPPGALEALIVAKLGQMQASSPPAAAA